MSKYIRGWDPTLTSNMYVQVMPFLSAVTHAPEEGK